jgi:DnaK suppressor protein
VTYLTDDQLRQIEALLSQREAQLQAEVRAMKQAMTPPPDTAGRDVRDRVDDGDERLLVGLDHVQLVRDQEELRDIEEARERIRKGSYGHCLECGEPIGVARLLAQPTAKFCLLHQAAWEKAHPAAPRFTM